MTYGYGVQSITPMVGATYILSARVRSPSSNTSVKHASLYTYIAPGTVYYAVTVEDVWQTLSRTGAPATAGAMNIGGSMAMGAAGDVGYFDNFCIHQHRSLATVTRGNANATAQAGIVMPASGVVPFGIVARYQDLANYWAWEIIPGTAGNDFQLVRMQAGVRTVLAAADIDWVAETAYTLKFTHVGNVYTGYVNDVARLSYTDGASFLATETAFGIIEGKTSNGGFDWFQLN